ncbi:hypothetical protein [Mangrovibacter phragmitis]|uniref:hypothetical protein n=1 Tax=Mangrovibacter phragmitis TaxID=1691903 RepID=UPI00336AA07E
MTTKTTARLTTGATVNLTIQIRNLGSWAPDCPLHQVYSQAIAEAKHRVIKAFEGKNISFVGEPVVRAITTDMEKK